jgi:hypothetical protein
MKLVNPTPGQKLRNVGQRIIQRFGLVAGGLTFSVAMVLLFFGGALYAMLAGFAAAAGVVHLFDGPTALAIILGIVFAFMAVTGGTGILLFGGAFLGAVYAWEWSWPIALIIFLPGIALIPLGFLAAVAMAAKSQFARRR